MDDSDDGNITISSKASSGKSEQIRSLNDRLLRESLTRQEFDELYQKLQSEYDNLLAKHAQAENTIDQLRIGARVDLFSDGPIPHKATQLQVIEVKTIPQPISVSSPQRAEIHWPHNTTTDAGNSIGEQSQNSLESRNNLGLNFLHRLKDLQNDIIAFQSALADRELSFEEQKNLYNALKDKHVRLKEHLMKSKDHDGKSHGVNFNTGVSHNFVDPNSLEGELYRLELRLAEVCDDIGDQLLSNRESGGALEQALRYDFQRMRLASNTSDHGQQKSPSSQLKLDNVKINHQPNILERATSNYSRSNSELSDRGRDGNSYTEQEGSPSNQHYRDKKETLSPSNEDLAESGYYASESMIRESPKRESVNMPLRYLTRSRSPGEKTHTESSLKRHWSLSEMNSETELIDEITIHSSDTDRPSLAGRPSSTSKQRSEKAHEDNTDGETRQSKASSKPTGLQHHSITGDGNVGPAATSSPLEEKRAEQVTPRDRDSAKEAFRDKDIKDSPDGNDVQRAKSRKSRNERLTRASPSDKSLLEIKSDGRRSSVKSGSRLSKTRPKQSHYTSSEESYPANRPERVNSSVYSEQDRVPSLVNHPKGNVYGTRHRPNTAESNLDSGFVGSEGTLRSQEMSNGGKQGLVRSQRRQTTTVDQTRPQRPMSLTSEPSFVSSESRMPGKPSFPTTSQERLSRGSRRDSSLGRLSERTQESRIQPGSSTGLRHDTEHRSSGRTEPPASSTKKPSYRLREKSRSKIPVDDVISLQTSPETQTDMSYRPLPITAERSPFASNMRLQELDLADSPLKTQRSRRDSNSDYSLEENANQSNRNKRTSFTGFSAAGSSQRARPHIRERLDPSFNGSTYSSVGRRPSQQTDRLRDDLQILREQLAKLNRYRSKPHAAMNSSALEKHPRLKETSPERSYDHLKRKFDELNHELQKSLQNTPDGDRQYMEQPSEANRSYQIRDRDYEDLKDKIDFLTRELQNSREWRPQHEMETRVDFQSPIRQHQPIIPGESHPTAATTPIARHKTPAGRSHTTPAPESQLAFMHESQRNNVSESQPTFIPVCPVCSGVGFHKHGSYVFPRDFLSSGQPVRIIPENTLHEVKERIASTPVGAAGRLVTPVPGHTVTEDLPSQSPLGHTVLYRSMPNLTTALGGSPVYPVANTIHHIHTFHGKRRPKSPSVSSGTQSEDEEYERRTTRRRTKSRNRRSRLLDEYDDWRLDESLNEATKAAGNMQRVSRKMLNNLATDLIRSGYSEY